MTIPEPRIIIEAERPRRSNTPPKTGVRNSATMAANPTMEPAISGSIPYLETIMAALSRANLVESAVGKSGGYRLTRSPEDYPVGEILRAVEGNLSPIACQSEDGSGCGASCDCDARLFWQGLEDQINSYVDNHTLAQFMRVNEKTPAVLNGTERR